MIERKILNSPSTLTNLPSSKEIITTNAMVHNLADSICLYYSESHLFPYTFVYTYIDMQINTYINIYVYMQKCSSLCIYISTCINTYVCVYNKEREKKKEWELTRSFIIMKCHAIDRAQHLGFSSCNNSSQKISPSQEIRIYSFVVCLFVFVAVIVFNQITVAQYMIRQNLFIHSF